MVQTPKKPKDSSVEPPKRGAKPNALQQKLTPSDALAAIVGAAPLARGDVISKLWACIKSNKLQDPEDGRQILADDRLEKIFGKTRVSMFEMNKFLASHLS
jgi:chromatin remodeling complex protein RSC6